MNRLLVATHNRGKMQELFALLGDLPISLVTPEDIGLTLTVTEDGDTYLANARKKASAFAEVSGMTAFADDSGLEVDALGGAPGLRSKRYLGRDAATDADRRAFLLMNLRGKSRPWRARFRAAVVVAVPNGELHAAEGDCRGEILPEERGSGGFGYDPIFLVEETGKTMAELGLAEKNLISHRARAVAKARPILIRLFGR